MSALEGASTTESKCIKKLNDNTFMINFILIIINNNNRLCSCFTFFGCSIFYFFFLHAHSSLIFMMIKIHIIIMTFLIWRVRLLCIILTPNLHCKLCLLHNCSDYKSMYMLYSNKYPMSVVVGSNCCHGVSVHVWCGLVLK